jgi:hypothetical protein
MPINKTRTFSANVGDKSIGNAGPDAIEQDIDNLIANDELLYQGLLNAIEFSSENEYDINEITTNIGEVTELTTSNKVLVKAINELDADKVEKNPYKQLSTNDYTDIDKAKVDKIGTEPLESVAQTIIGAINETRAVAGGGIALSTYYDNRDSTLIADNVKTALDEVDNKVENLETGLSNGTFKPSDADKIDGYHVVVVAEASKGTDANTIYFCY